MPRHFNPPGHEKTREPVRFAGRLVQPEGAESLLDFHHLDLADPHGGTRVVLLDGQVALGEVELGVGHLGVDGDLAVDLARLEAAPQAPRAGTARYYTTSSAFLEDVC